jgi:outer membrane protein assembly factor BamB
MRTTILTIALITLLASPLAASPRIRKLERIEWTYQAGVKIGRAEHGAGGPIRVMAGGGNIHGVDPATGKGLWAAGGHTNYWNYSSCVLGADGTAYGGNHTWVSAVRPDGKLRWRTSLKASWIHGPPALSPDGKTLYVGADNVGIASLDAATGEINWLRRDFKSPWTRYAFDPAGRVIAGFPTRVVCFEADGSEAWQIPGAVSTMLTVGNRLVVSRGKKLEALDLGTRKRLFAVDLGSKVHGTVLGDDGRIAVTLASGELAQVDIGGRFRWRRRISGKPLSQPATGRGGETVVMDTAGKVYLLDSNGIELSSIETGGSYWRWRPSIGPDGRVFVNHHDRLICIGGAEREPPRPVRATSMLVVADDFLVDAWVNGKLVPLSAREMRSETFGATTERIRVDVREGDWVVFNVVANRLRWGGACYFGVHAIDDDWRVGFVTRPGAGWSACDDPSDVTAFIAERDAGTDRPAIRPKIPWSGGKDRFREQLGKPFTGEPIWGRSANTWIKYVVPASKAAE